MAYFFNITRDFDLADLAGVPSDGTKNTKYTAGETQGFTDVDENGFPTFTYSVGAFSGNSGWFWADQTVGVPVPDYGTVSGDSSADGATTTPAVVSTNVLGMPPTIGKAVVVLAVLGGAFLLWKKFHKIK